VRFRSPFLIGLLLALFISCRPEAPDLSLRLESDDMKFTVIPDPVPPRARETITYKVVVRDSKTGQPIETGQGRIFATSMDKASTYDALLPGEQLGTYYGKLSFITSGPWAMAIQFKRDSTKSLERLDWMQEVFAARGESKR
jgi:hypothetical protein